MRHLPWFIVLCRKLWPNTANTGSTLVKLTNHPAQFVRQKDNDLAHVSSKKRRESEASSAAVYNSCSKQAWLQLSVHLPLPPSTAHSYRSLLAFNFTHFTELLPQHFLGEKLCHIFFSSFPPPGWFGLRETSLQRRHIVPGTLLTGDLAC